MNPYSDFCFWIQDALETRKDITSYFLVRLVVVEYDPEFDWNVLKEFRVPKKLKFGFSVDEIIAENQMTGASPIKWNVGCEIFPQEITYTVTKEKAPLYDMSKVGTLSHLIEYIPNSIDGTWEDEIPTMDVYPIYELGKVDPSSYYIPGKASYGLPIMKADPPGGTVFKMGPVTPKPFPEPNTDIWKLIYNGPEGSGYLNTKSIKK